MKFQLLTYLDERAWDGLGPTEQERLIREGTQFAKQLAADGMFLGESPLQSVVTATSVRVREHWRSSGDRRPIRWAAPRFEIALILQLHPFNLLTPTRQPGANKT